MTYSQASRFFLVKVTNPAVKKQELHRHRWLLPHSPISHPIKRARAFSAFTPRLNISSEVEKLCHSSRCHSTVPLWRWLVRRRSARMAIAHCQAVTARHRLALPNCLRGAAADMTWMSRRSPPDVTQTPCDNLQLNAVFWPIEEPEKTVLISARPPLTESKHPGPKTKENMEGAELCLFDLTGKMVAWQLFSRGHSKYRSQRTFPWKIAT